MMIVFVVLSLLCHISHSQIESQQYNGELQALMKLKASLTDSNHQNPVLSSWKIHKNSGSSVCNNFTGISCDAEGFVSEIDLSNQQLFSGSLPFHAICSLKSLKKLSLGYNSLYGMIISDDLRNCTELQSLELGFNSFSGKAPDLTPLRKLKLLSLEYCNFSGHFPWKSLENLTDLEFLSLQYNTFEPSPFPREILKLDKLRFLYLSNSSLAGELPKGFGNLTRLVNFHAAMNFLSGNLTELRKLSRLESLMLYENEFSGEIPAEISELKSLVGLCMYRNKLTGEIPQSSFSWKVLELIDLSRNYLTGEIPTSMCVNGKLTYLVVSVNKLSGEVPASCGVCVSLKTLLANKNLLSGFVPEKIWSLPNLRWLDLSMNRLEGQLSEDIGKAKNLVGFVLTGNKFSGEIPNSICSMTSLSELDFSYNNLTGNIPRCMASLSDSLYSMDLHWNKLHGTIPSIFTRGNRLQNLNLNGNKLEGELPKSLINCTILEVLDLGNNMFNDTFPHWLGSLPKLQVLVLRANRFHGSIENPGPVHQFLSLGIIDLSRNEFTGALPTKYFENFKAMKTGTVSAKRDYVEGGYYLASVTVTIKGHDYDLLKILTMFTSIDFSMNNFTGEIPEPLGKLNALKGLNLSCNMLTGNLPSSLGNLSNLEWLDLSSNDLVGEIPLELAYITSLQILKLSYNHLEGLIPRGKQFNTFENESFYGNPDLCGFPLTITCGEDANQPSTPDSNQDDDNGSIDWKTIAMMGFGSGLVIGISIGYMLLYSDGKLNWISEAILEELQYRTRSRKPKKSRNARRS